MHIENMKAMMECLCTKAKSEIDGNIDCVNTEELGEVIDMIKDLNEGLYYAKITKEMEEAKEENEVFVKTDPESMRYYGGRKYYYDPVIHSGRYYNSNRYYNPSHAYMTDGMRMYNDNRYSNGRYAPDGNTTRNYTVPYPDMYDPANSINQNKWRLNSPSEKYRLESRYDAAKRGYENSKINSNNDSPDGEESKLHSLEEYMKELSTDVTEIIQDASQEEQNLLKQKLQGLINKIR